jgi:DNA-binding MarR family transcriptional regulator
MEDDPLRHAELTLLLGLAFQGVVTEFVRRLDQRGYAELRPLHGVIFQQLKNGGPTSTELARRLGVTKQAMGQIIAELEALGYVRRTEHPNGGRWRLVVLTEKAADHLAVAGPVLHQLEAELAARLEDNDLARLRGELAQVVRVMAGEEIPPLRPMW